MLRDEVWDATGGHLVMPLLGMFYGIKVAVRQGFEPWEEVKAPSTV